MQFIPIYPRSLMHSPVVNSLSLQLFIANQHFDLRGIKDKELPERFPAAWKSKSPYIILDNGAFEGRLIDDSDLIILGNTIIQNAGSTVELVVPDVLGDKNATLDKFKKFLGLLRQNIKSHNNIMIVPQGRDANEWFSCYLQMVQIAIDPYYAERVSISAVGIPKWVAADKHFAASVEMLLRNINNQNMYSMQLTDWPLMYNFLTGYSPLMDYLSMNYLPPVANKVGQQLTRLKMVMILEHLRRTSRAIIPPMQIHMLGLANFTEIGISPLFKVETAAGVFNTLNLVRSLDSTILYNMSFQGLFDFNPAIQHQPDMVEYYRQIVEASLDSTGNLKSVNRPHDFFNLTTDDFSLGTVYCMLYMLKGHFQSIASLNRVIPGASL